MLERSRRVRDGLHTNDFLDVKLRRTQSNYAHKTCCAGPTQCRGCVSKGTVDDQIKATGEMLACTGRSLKAVGAGTVEAAYF